METDWKLFDQCYPELADPGPVEPPKTQEDHDYDLDKHIDYLIKFHGLDRLLSRLILNLTRSNSDGKAPYLVDAADGIKRGLAEYRRRYEKYPEE